MGCLPSKRKPHGSSYGDRIPKLVEYPKLDPSVSIPTPQAIVMPPLPRPDEQQVQKLVKMGFAADDVRSALQVFNGDEILAIKKLRSAERAPAGNDKNTKPTSVSRSTKGVPVQRSGGGAAIGFKGRKVGASTPPKSQPLGGKSKKANKGAKSSK